MGRRERGSAGGVRRGGRQGGGHAVIRGDAVLLWRRPVGVRRIAETIVATSPADGG